MIAATRRRHFHGRSDMSDDSRDRGDKEKKTDSEDDARSQRRRSLRRMLAGAGVVTAAGSASGWGKPVIDSVLLPAHAQATDGAS
jgi:hypothetical protein